MGKNIDGGIALENGEGWGIGEISGLNIRRIRFFGSLDSMLGVDGVLLEFDDYFVSILINYDDSSLFWHKRNVFPQYGGQIEVAISDIERFYGIVAYIWLSYNQYRYCDAVQISVLINDKEYNLLQFMGGGGGILLYSLSHERISSPNWMV